MLKNISNGLVYFLFYKSISLVTHMLMIEVINNTSRQFNGEFSVFFVNVNIIFEEYLLFNIFL